MLDFGSKSLEPGSELTVQHLVQYALHLSSLSLESHRELGPQLLQDTEILGMSVFTPLSPDIGKMSKYRVSLRVEQ